MKQVKPKKFLGQHFLKDLSIAKAIADTVEKRIRNVAEMKMSYVPAQTTSTEYDVEKDIAEDYGPKMV